MGNESTTAPQGTRARRVRQQLVLALGVVIAAGTVWAQGGALPLVLPSAIAYDAQGNLYIADRDGQVVREYSAAGALTVVAGTGVQGFAGDGGPATAAELDSPMGLAVDAAGDVFFADSHNQRVRKIAAGTGVISTVAGTGVAGFGGDGGAATAARLNGPSGLAVDAAGNLYVADARNHRVRKVAAGNGVITTVVGTGVQGFAGDGGAAVSAELDSPGGLAVDAAGNLYIADTRNGRVRVVEAATGVISTVAGVGASGGNLQVYGGDGGTATAAGLALPRGVWVDAAGNVYVADSGNQRVRRVSAAGVITTVAGQGTEGFSGDGGPAVAASLDLPRGVVVSPAGLITVADSHNARVRQVDAESAPGPDIHTLVASVPVQETLALNGPSTVVYGSGLLTATLTAVGSATGTVTFQDGSGGVPVTLGSAALGPGGVASFSLAGLAAGAHSIVATYAGDATHAAVQSQALGVMVTPLGVTATPNPAQMLYGQAVPALTGTLAGVLAQDAGKVSAVYATSAGAMAAVGAYPITASLAGGAAGNYSLTVAPANVTIAQAPTVTVVTLPGSGLGAGSSATLGVQVSSTTNGVPTGSVVLMDGSVALGTVALAGGVGSFTTGSLGFGTHSFSAVYGGDVNFQGSTSAVAAVVVGAAPDFTLTPTGATTQAVPAGTAATFSFAVGVQGGSLASPITLAVQGLPLGATASLNPQVLVPGATATSFTLTIQTPVAMNEPAGGGPAKSKVWLALVLLPVIRWRGCLRKQTGRALSLRWRLAAAAIASILMASVVTGCGDRVNQAPEFSQAKSYTITVTGTATGPTGAALQHSANVILEVL